MRPRAVSTCAALALFVLASGCKSKSIPGNPALGDPSLAKDTAPETFAVRFDTTAGDIVLSCTRSWAPHGVDRFYNLVKIGFFDDVAFFRVVRSPTPFVAQFGIHGNPDVNERWLERTIEPDEPKQSNTRGRLTFAMADKPSTRATQLFINYADNTSLDRLGFAPICEVTEGMQNAEKLYDGYGEGLTEAQGKIAKEGNAFLRKEYPKLDYIKSAKLVEAAPPTASARP